MTNPHLTDDARRAAQEAGRDLPSYTLGAWEEQGGQKLKANLLLTAYQGGPGEPHLELEVARAGGHGPWRGIQLTQQQARELRDELTAWLARVTTPADPRLTTIPRPMLFTS